MKNSRAHRKAGWLALAAAAVAATGCASGGAGGPRLSSNGRYFYVAPEHAGFASPQMAAGDAVAWSLHRSGTFSAPASSPGTAIADAPVD
jgi:hypothetical protein